MSDTARKTPTPTPADTFAELEHELSEVRARPNLRRPSSSSIPDVPGSSPRDSVGAAAVERGERIERKLRIAHALLDDLPPSDPRARLLRAAIIRRDEALLDGLLYDR